MVYIYFDILNSFFQFLKFFHNFFYLYVLIINTLITKIDNKKIYIKVNFSINILLGLNCNAPKL